MVAFHRTPLSWSGVTLLLGVCLLCSGPCRSQSENPSELNAKLNVRIPVGTATGDFLESLGQAARVFGIPMGISWVKTASSQQKRSVEYENATVLEIIEDIAKTEPGYEVRIANGVVHVATTAVPPGQNFLYLQVPHFSTKGVANAAKVQLWMQLNQQISPDPSRGYAGSILSSASDPKLDLQLADVRVEEILDSIAVASDYKVWVATFDDDTKLTPSGFRRTESITLATSTADEAQPVWDMFYWSHWLITLVPSRSSTTVGNPDKSR